MKPLENFVIVVAAGNGLRMGSAVKKQYLCLGGIPILSRTIMAFDKTQSIHEIVLVIPKEENAYCIRHILEPYGFKKKIHLVEGGTQRQLSVLNGLKHVQNIMNPDKETIVLIHDGVRPFIDQHMIEACIQNTVKYGACIPAVKLTDTLKKVTPDLVVEKTINRASLYQAQTPQAFKLKLILNAFDHAMKTCFSGTDDASLLEHSGYKVHVINGSKLNIKITSPEDLVMGERFLSANA